MTKSPQASFDLSGKVALVTGGSRGLGREMVLAFARAGADVIVASRKLAACESLADEVRDEIGRRALAVECHVGRWNDCDALVETAYAELGRVDVLVNNAGMSPLYESLDAVSEELFDKVQAVNLRGPFRLTSLIATRMAAGAGGSVINVSSIAAVQPSPNEIPYALAKAGINAMTIGMARAFAPKVRVNCIMPGPFLTDISKAWDLDAFKRAAESAIPLQRGGAPHEVVGAALYLASEASSYTTGAILKIDGGAAFAPA
jgi:NAD(P)-dependent dehydrogenase (short-subunit alcohol dehydrogenase family)